MNAKKVLNDPRSYLPSRPYCIGREKEKEKCLEALLPSASGWGVIIDGMGGIGKSTLALLVAHTAKGDRKFDVYNYVDERSLTTSDEVVQTLAVSLGYKEEIKQASDIAEYCEKLVLLLGERNTLLIFDNMDGLSRQERERISKFLCDLPMSTKVILTVRNRSGFSGADVRIPLRQLYLQDTSNWVRREIKDAPYQPLGLDDAAVVRSLHDGTGGNPYVLKYVLGLILEQGLLYTKAIERVQDATKSPDLYRSIFSDAVRNLTDIEKDILATCAGVGKKVDIQTLCRLTARPDNELEHASLRLTGLLLVNNLGFGLYSLPPLVLSYVRTTIREMLPTTSEGPFKTIFSPKCYCDGLRYWVDFATDTIASDTQRLVSFRNEWPTLKFVANELCELTRSSDESAGYAAEILADLVYALGSFLQDPSRCSEFTHILRSLGDWFSTHGDIDRVRAHFELVLTLPVGQDLRAQASNELHRIGGVVKQLKVSQPIGVEWPRNFKFESTNGSIDETYTDLEIRIALQDKAQGLYAVTAKIDGDGDYSGVFEFASICDQLKTDSVEDYGVRLSHTLFVNGIKRAYDRAQERACSVAAQQGRDKNTARLRLRLIIANNAAALHAVVWERLQHQVEGKSLPIVTDANQPFSRDFGLERDKSYAIAGPVRMLCIISNPEDLEKYNLTSLCVETEVDNLRGTLGALRKFGIAITVMSGRTELSADLTSILTDIGCEVVAGPITLKRLRQRLTDPGYHLVHFLGHGVFDGKRAALILENNYGQVCIVKEDDLANELAGLVHKPYMVFLAACQGAVRAVGVTNPFVGLAPSLVQIGIPVVVAMQDRISVDAVRTLTQEFYPSLLRHGIVDKAFNEARVSLRTLDCWDVPVLFMHLREGRLLNRDSLVQCGRVRG